MGAYIITNRELTAIANAIRQKLSSSDRYLLDDMPTAIANIGITTGQGAVTVEGNDNKYLINENKIKAIANAVRAKNGLSTEYTISELPQAINDIVTTTHTVVWKNGDTVLETDTDVPYGTMPHYDGVTPTSPDGGFIGWEPTVTAVSGDVTYSALFGIPLVEPDLKYLLYTIDDENMTIKIRGLNIANIVADNLQYITIPDTIQGHHVILA